MVITLTQCPEGWPGNSTFWSRYVGCKEVEGYFEDDVVDLAKKLVGEYLYCHESRIVVRILETEAFPEDDADVYNKVFDQVEGNAQFRLKAGMVVARRLDGADPGPDEGAICDTALFITAGDADSGDVVLLKSFEPIEGRHLIEHNNGLKTTVTPVTQKKILIGPFKISRGTGGRSPPWNENPVLHDESGIQLFRSDPPEANSKALLCRRRYFVEDGRTTNELSGQCCCIILTRNTALPWTPETRITPTGGSILWNF